LFGSLREASDGEHCPDHFFLDNHDFIFFIHSKLLTMCLIIIVPKHCKSSAFFYIYLQISIVTHNQDTYSEYHADQCYQLTHCCGIHRRLAPQGFWKNSSSGKVDKTWNWIGPSNIVKSYVFVRLKRTLLHTEALYFLVLVKI
jgi:hypothetical protein